MIAVAVVLAFLLAVSVMHNVAALHALMEPRACPRCGAATEFEDLLGTRACPKDPQHTPVAE